MSKVQYPKGIDLVWAASDKSGRVGAFITGGEGPLPRAVLDEPGYDMLEVESLLLGLPSTSAVELLVSVPRPESFVALAQRGLYVFDWTDVCKVALGATHSYELVARPRDPIYVKDLPDAVGLAVQALGDTIGSFSDRTQIGFMDRKGFASG